MRSSQLEVEVLLRQSQDTMARFLAVEIRTGFTFVELAGARDIRFAPERRMALKKQAQVAASSVKRLKDRLDYDRRDEIESRLAALERAINSL